MSRKFGQPRFEFLAQLLRASVSEPSEFFQEECAAFTSPMARPDCSEFDDMVWGGQSSSNVDTLSAWAVRVVSNEMLLNRKIKKSGQNPKGMRLRLLSLIAKARPRGCGSASGVPPQLLLRL
jgi:hypothetical protein